jgi:hypothetical protein
MLQLLVHLQVARLSRPDRPRDSLGGVRARRLSGSVGQTTAEYALVLLGAAAVAVLVITWASKTDAVGKLFDFVLGHVIGSVK